MDTTKQPKSVISFCSGYAGIERGLELAGLKLRTLAFVEIEAFAIANLVAKMETGSLDPAPVWSNLKTFPSHLFRDRVDILTGGYPCQPFSAAGKRAGKDDPRHLWPWIRQHIDTMRPVRCFFENVEGHITLGLREVIEDLEELGYKTTFGIFSASEVGAPHQRKRVYILGDSVGSRQQALRNQSRPEWETETVSQSSELADSDSERWAKHDRKQGSSSKGKRTDKGRGQTIRSGATGAVADSDSEQQRRDSALDENTQRQTSSGTKPSWRGTDVADSSSTRGATWLSRPKRSDKERHSEVANNSRDRSGWRQSADQWATEPRLGRVVDGCPDRVDRLRLLGNGVVPQTAAKAWTVLDKEITK